MALLACCWLPWESFFTRWRGKGPPNNKLYAKTESVAMWQAYWEIQKKLLIVPYVPGSTDNARPLANFEQPILPLEQRQTLLFFRATCLPFLYVNENNTRIGTGKVCFAPLFSPTLQMQPTECQSPTCPAAL